MEPPLLGIHIIAASVGLIAGAMALAVTKGRTVHRRSGIVFVYAMVTMCGAAIVLAALRGQATNVIAGSVTLYLVVTALTTVRRPRARSRRVDRGAMWFGLGAGVAAFALAVKGFTSATGTVDGLPPYPFIMFGFLGVLGARGDWRELKAGGLRGVPRLTRHLWRMCFALFIATISFFSIRARVVRVLPDAIVTPLVQALPVIAVLAALGYWLWRVRRHRPRSPLARFQAEGTTR